MPQPTSLQAVIFDWAGTLVDFGSRAPVQAFLRLFDEEGIDVQEAQARAPMGLAKCDHIQAMLAMPAIRDQWMKKHSKAPDAADLERLYARFIPLQLEIIEELSAPIPGAREVLEGLRQQGLRIGTTTGYTRELAQPVLKIARAAGLAFENAVTVSDVPRGRPAPDMALESLRRLGLEAHEAKRCVKVGDTLADIQEGLNAGMWCVALSASGNALGLPRERVEAMPPEKLGLELARIEREFLAAGAHEVIPSVAELPAALARIQETMTSTRSPS